MEIMMGCVSGIEDILDCSSEARIVLKNIRSDIPVKWLDEDSGITIIASKYEMSVVLVDLNQIMAVGTFLTLDDCLQEFTNDSVIFPNELDEGVLMNGWCAECFSCYEGLFINLRVGDPERHDGSVIFPFSFVLPYCSGCYDCMGCDGRNIEQSIVSQKLQIPY